MTSPTTRRTHGIRPPPPIGWTSSAAASALTRPADPASSSMVLMSAPPYGRRRPERGALRAWFARCARSYSFHRSPSEEAGRSHEQHPQDEDQGQRHLDAVEEVEVLDGQGVGDAHHEPGDDGAQRAVEPAEGSGGEG